MLSRSQPKLHPPLLMLIGLLLTSPLMGCTAPSPNVTSATTTSAAPTQTQLRVVATFLPIYLFTKAVAGDVAKVDILIKPGTEVHDYQATPSDIQTLAQADLLVTNGLGIEEFLEGSIKNAQNTALKVVDTSTGIPPISDVATLKPGGSSHSSHSAEPHAAGNPHIWLDPVLAQKQVETIRSALIAADPTHQATYTANAAAYIQKLKDLDRQFQQRLEKYPDRTFVTFHNAFPYLAKRYQLQQVAVIEVPEEQLSPVNVRTTITAVKQFKAKALLSEPGVSPKLLDSLAQDLKLPLRPLDSLEVGQLDPQYYFVAMGKNLKTLEAAFR